jgi:carboxymethylenebutenolidase
VDTPASRADRLEAGSVQYDGTGAQPLVGYLARPAGHQPLPAVIVVQEWWGLDEHIKDVTRRLALEGYVALAPDLYHGEVAAEPDEARKLVMELDIAVAVDEIRVAMDYVLGRSDALGTKVGVVGFCMGGRLALKTCVADKRVGAAVAFYGRPLDASSAAIAQAPILGVYAGEDHGIPVADARAMHAALTAAGIDNALHVYDGVDHAFFNDTRAAYDAEAAKDAWARLLDFLGARLTA